MKPTILAFGELLWDLLPDGPRLGGAPANFAFRMANLGHSVALVSRVGNDANGEKAVHELRQNGVETDFIQRDSQFPTGTVAVRVNNQGEPDYTINPGAAYDRIEFSDVLKNLVAENKCICFGTLVQKTQRSRETLATVLESAPHALKVLDINLRKDCSTPETILHSLERADILKLNEDEAGILAEMFSLPSDPQRFGSAVTKQFSLECCVITLGSAGSRATQLRNGIERHCQVPGFKVQVLDTCGAGDAFTAAFLHQYFQNASLETCCRYGNALGALVAAQPGAMARIATSEIEALVRS